MSKINDGGPAFPLPFILDPTRGEMGMYVDAADAGVPTGLSVRDYFIAHAPAEPQPWFRPAMPRPCPERILKEGCDYPINGKERHEWHVEFERQRWIQWPAAWADEQLKAREVLRG